MTDHCASDSERHPADKAYDEVMDEIAGRPYNLSTQKAIAEEMRDRWKNFGDNADTDTDRQERGSQ